MLDFEFTHGHWLAVNPPNKWRFFNNIFHFSIELMDKSGGACFFSFVWPITSQERIYKSVKLGTSQRSKDNVAMPKHERPGRRSWNVPAHRVANFAAHFFRISRSCPPGPGTSEARLSRCQARWISVASFFSKSTSQHGTLFRGTLM